MTFTSELWETVRKLSALEARCEDVVRSLERIEGKVDNLIDRISRVEARYEHLREAVRNEILADIKADLALVQVRLEQQKSYNSRTGSSSLLSPDAPSSGS